MLGSFANLAVAQSASRVVVARDPAAVSGLDVVPDRVHALVDRGMQALTGQSTPAAAWAMFAGPDDVVGIKVNVRAAPLHVPRPALIDAIAAGLQSAGVAATNIIVWDVDPHRLRRAGYAGNARFQVRAVIEDTGWDENITFESKVVGKLIWGDLEFGRDATGISEKSHFPKLLTRTITKLINVPVLIDHDACGLAGALYNVSLGVVDNARRFDLGGSGETEIPEICATAVVQKKLVLTIMDALVAGYAGGPAFKPQYSWPAATLYLSRDPVAVDTLCMEALEAQRQPAGIPPIGERAGHIRAAGLRGLGTADPDQIERLPVAP